MGRHDRGRLEGGPVWLFGLSPCSWGVRNRLLLIFATFASSETLWSTFIRLEHPLFRERRGGLRSRVKEGDSGRSFFPNRHHLPQTSSIDCDFPTSMFSPSSQNQLERPPPTYFGPLLKFEVTKMASSLLF